MNLRIEVAAGMSAGVVGTVLGYPLDTIKTHMQTSGQKGILSTFQEIYKSEGISGFYRGIASPLLSLTILNTVNFTMYNTFKRILHVEHTVTPNEFDFRIPLAASAVAPISSMISTPFELLKLKMQLQKSLPIEQQYKNTFLATMGILRQEGIRGLYTGHAVNTSREVVFLAVYFSVYEHGKSFISTLLPKQLAVPIAGGVSGAIGWFASFPLDLVKSHIQTKSSGDSRFLPTFSKILQKRGILGLFSGVVPSVLRAFLVSSSRFTAYESTLWLLQDPIEA
jgi:solute carrier family 25 carnitine/acylcarnitine transporter 20/29